ncbi:hypothetical protein HMPREF0658_0602 [Hoylesella marshii DSM 16973 = JCM 13450]|uniref:Uncharacterized protein n=1 Tax=Hoylesella marshii DSM 16973 = JCM 13450 TaxID=862515 RepID=E0NR01_9BACT|nr:hypothetical protein HMPREF0658_0602 [Hoylesella marshii DSM 16973 = JCM 13450]
MVNNRQIQAGECVKKQTHSLFYVLSSAYLYNSLSLLLFYLFLLLFVCCFWRLLNNKA